MLRIVYGHGAGCLEKVELYAVQGMERFNMLLSIGILRMCPVHGAVTFHKNHLTIKPIAALSLCFCTNYHFNIYT